jgi:hypothetical protein
MKPCSLGYLNGSSTAPGRRCSAHCSRRPDAMHVDALRNAPFRSFRSIVLSSIQFFSFKSDGSLRKGIQGGTHATCKRCTCTRCMLREFMGSKNEAEKTVIGSTVNSALVAPK